MSPFSRKKVYGGEIFKNFSHVFSPAFLPLIMADLRLKNLILALYEPDRKCKDF
jgi:hypothetical protein